MLTTNVGSSHLQRPAARAAPPLRAGPAVPDELRLRPDAPEQLPVVPPADLTCVATSGTPGDLTHAFKATVVYDLPFGQGRRFGSGANAVVDRIIGGWTVRALIALPERTARQPWQRPPGRHDGDDVQKMYKLRFDDAAKYVYMLPQDVIDETIKAFSVSATSATGYGRSAHRAAATSRRRTVPTASRSRTTSATAARATWSSRADVPAARHQPCEESADGRAHATSNSAPRC